MIVRAVVLFMIGRLARHSFSIHTIQQDHTRQRIHYFVAFAKELRTTLLLLVQHQKNGMIWQSWICSILLYQTLKSPLEKL